MFIDYEFGCFSAVTRQSSDSESLEIQKITGHLECIRGGENLS
jgi:hypothetical protein